MILFFEDIDQMNQFTSSLEMNQGVVMCANCNQDDQFVSHGFVYKNLNQGKTIVTGKRLFCANRRQHAGCGCTLRLYLAEQIPTLVYSTAQMTTFLKALLACNTIQTAYKAATNTDDPRNAYRWLNQLTARLVNYRTFAQNPRMAPSPKVNFSTRRLQLLLPVINTIFVALGEHPCCHYQLDNQQAFV
jgi:hypothetical protein